MREKDRIDQIGTRREEATLPPQAERKHPGEWEDDLSPDRMAGQNIGIPHELPTAHDHKELHGMLSDFTSDELREIPVVRPGERLHQGATYLDLSGSEGARREFTATGGMQAEEGELLVPKSEVPYTLWNRLRGIDDPKRTT